MSDLVERLERLRRQALADGGESGPITIPYGWLAEAVKAACAARVLNREAELLEAWSAAAPATTLPPQGQPKPVEARDDLEQVRQDCETPPRPSPALVAMFRDGAPTPATTEAGGLHWIDALPYQATFNAIGDALNLPKGSTVGISVEAFQNSLRAALASSPL